MHINGHAAGVEDFDFASGAQIEVYVFENADGNMDSYYTVDPVLAKQYAIDNNLAWIARKFDYVDSELVKDYREDTTQMDNDCDDGSYVDADGDCSECGHPANNASGHGSCQAQAHN